MESLLYLTLVIAIKILFCSAANCPHGFSYCVQEGQTCNLPTTYTYGVMSYGNKQVYSLIPFTKGYGASMSIKCNNDNGDILPGVAKYCCVDSINTPIFPTQNWQGLISEGSNSYFSDGLGYTSQRYGANGKYVYRPVNRAKGWCNNDFYNDPVYQTGKHCNYNTALPATLPASDNYLWTRCGDYSSRKCTGLQLHRSTWVRYQEGTSRFYYRLVYCMQNGIFDGKCKIPCTQAFFGADPDPHYSYTIGTCWRSNNYFIISDAPPQISPPDQFDEPDSFTPLQVDIGFIVIGLLVLVNIGCCLYYFYQKRRGIQNKYQSVIMVDSESDVNTVQ